MKQSEKPIDSSTESRVRAVITEARRNGLDIVEALNRAGLILTPDRRRTIELEALREALTNLEGWTPVEFLRRVNKSSAPTPKNMYDAILGYLADYVEKF